MKLLKDYQCIWLCVVFECWSGLNVNVPYRYSYWNTLWLVVLFWVGFGGVALLEGRLWGFILHWPFSFHCFCLVLEHHYVSSHLAVPAALPSCCHHPPPPHEDEALIPLEGLTNPSFCKSPWWWFLLTDKSYPLTKP